MNSNAPSDSYKTLEIPSPEILYKERKSKFYGYAFPISTIEEVKPILSLLRKKHRTANHLCYAWQLGVERKKYRTNDDGEPNNTAGMPIYGQLQSFKLTNVLVVVVRIFGGTKLGVGGLIHAYRTAAEMALNNALIVEKTIQQQLQLTLDYANLNKVMKLIKNEGIQILHQDLNTHCTLILSIRKKKMEIIYSKLLKMQEIEVEKL